MNFYCPGLLLMKTYHPPSYSPPVLNFGALGRSRVASISSLSVPYVCEVKWKEVYPKASIEALEVIEASYSAGCMSSNLSAAPFAWMSQ